MLKRLIVVVAVIAALAVPATAAAGAGGGKNIVETAAGSKEFSTLVSLVKRAGLVGTLSGSKPYTVFAPTNAAFAKVPKKTLTMLMESRSLLRKVLLYHVLPGKVPASKVLKTKSATTAEGEAVQFSVRGKSAYVNESKIVKTDIECSNGIIHVIDTVLIPPNLPPPPPPRAGRRRRPPPPPPPPPPPRGPAASTWSPTRCSGRCRSSPRSRSGCSTC